MLSSISGPIFSLTPRPATRSKEIARVLGIIRKLVNGGQTAIYISTEDWLLPNWELLVKKRLMVEDGEKILQEAREYAGVELPA